MRTSLTSAALAAAALLLTAGCYTWRPTTTVVEGSAPRVIPHVRITLVDGTELTLRSSILTPDSVVGFTDSGVHRESLASTSSLEERQFSPLKTLALGLAHGAVYVGWTAVTTYMLPHKHGVP